MIAASAVAIATFLTVNAVVPRVEPPGDRIQADSRYFSDCEEARESGDAPIYQGEPGYRDALDRDGDGVACEPSFGH